MDAKAGRLVWFFASIWLAASAHAEPRWNNPQPQGNIIADVTWSSSAYVAVGNAGTILLSNDGAAWQPVNSGTTAWLEAVRWDDARKIFIASGNGGALLTSPDGQQWTRRASGAEGYLYGIAGNAAVDVVVGSSGVVATSTDGINWTAGSAGTTDWLNDVAWNGSEFMAVGSNGTLMASVDGVHWSRRNSPIRNSAGSGPSLEAIAWSPELNRWVAVSEIGAGPQGNAYIVWSNDGKAWQAVAAGTRSLRGITWDPAALRFVAVGTNGRVLVSGDGIAWGAPNDTGYGESLETVAAGANGYVAAGEHGLILTTADPAGGWTRQGNGVLASLTGVAFDGTGYVAVGDGTILFGATPGGGVTVIEQAQGAALPFLRGVAWGAGNYVAVGDGGVILRSVDGINWSVDATTGTNLHRVTQAPDGSWYAVGDHGGVWRNGGTGWTQVRTGSESINGVVADAAGIMAVGTAGAGGVVLTSSDGTHWSAAATGTHLFGAASGNGHRVAVGSHGTILNQNGKGWTAGNVGTSSDLMDVIWDGRRFVAVGRNGATFASGDGSQWSAQTITGNDLFGAATASAGAFIAVGEGGTVVDTACPCATNDNAVTAMDHPVNIPVLANDSGDNLLLRAVDSHSAWGGSIAANPDGSVTYTPANRFIGTDNFSYTLGSSVDPAATDTATVTVIVNGRSGGAAAGGGGGSALSLLLPLIWGVTRRLRAL